MTTVHFEAFLKTIADFQLKNSQAVDMQEKTRIVQVVHDETYELLVKQLNLVELFKVFTTYLPSEITRAR